MKKFYLKFSVDNRMFDTDQQFLLGEDIKRMAHVPLEFDLYLVICLIISRYRDICNASTKRDKNGGICLRFLSENGLPHCRGNLFFKSVVK